MRFEILANPLSIHIPACDAKSCTHRIRELHDAKHTFAKPGPLRVTYIPLHALNWPRALANVKHKIKNVTLYRLTPLLSTALLSRWSRVRVPPNPPPGKSRKGPQVPSDLTLRLSRWHSCP